MIVRSGTDGVCAFGESSQERTVEDLFWELVSIPQLLSHPNFSLEVLMIRKKR
jgi:hypothetical protein